MCLVPAERAGVNLLVCAIWQLHVRSVACKHLVELVHRYSSGP